ncbi:MAG: hypothetical protein ACREN7_00115 [Candidatus Dormibacteria bacterium]
MREQLAVLREQTPLTSGEISALRVLARAEVARLEARTRWRLRWSRWTTRQRLGFAMAVMVGLVTIANQIVSLLQGLMPVRPGP